jgi:hypothetical protein
MSELDLFNDTPETAPPLPTTAGAILSQEIRAIRSSHEYQMLRKQFRFLEEHRWVNGKKGAPCWLCGGDIDYRLSHPHPYCWELDHAITAKEAPQLILEPSNFRSSHRDCNIQRGTDDPKLDIGTPSEIW